MKDFLILLVIATVCLLSALYSEWVQTNLHDWNVEVFESRSANLTNDIAYQTLGYTIPKKDSFYMPHYWYLYWTFGKGVADFVLGQLGDLTYPTGFGAAMGLLVLIRRKDDYKKEALWGLIGVSNCVSGFYITVELFNMIDPPNGCGLGSGAFCTGEWIDILVFSVPQISTLLWVLLYTILHNRAPN